MKAPYEDKGDHVVVEKTFFNGMVSWLYYLGACKYWWLTQPESWREYHIDGDVEKMNIGEALPREPLPVITRDE